MTVVNNNLAAAVEQTLRYFALFRFPLNQQDLHRFCSFPCTDSELQYCLDDLLQMELIFREKGFYANSPEIAQWVERRLAGNQKAAVDIPRAQRIGRMIFQFPFVEFVGISGSLSKGYSDARADFDFFIITTSNRLWISRTLLHLFKKLTFLFGQQHKFCMNYFMDAQVLRLEERNVYTATELSTLIPVCGSELYQYLMRENCWLKQHFPNQILDKTKQISDHRSRLTNGLNWTLNHLFPQFLNRSLMRLTDIKWRRKWAAKGYPQEDYNLAFKTSLHVSKNHPANYQKKILKAIVKNTD